MFRSFNEYRLDEARRSGNPTPPPAPTPEGLDFLRRRLINMVDTVVNQAVKNLDREGSALDTMRQYLPWYRKLGTWWNRVWHGNKVANQRESSEYDFEFPDSVIVEHEAFSELTQLIMEGPINQAKDRYANEIRELGRQIIMGINRVFQQFTPPETLGTATPVPGTPTDASVPPPANAASPEAEIKPSDASTPPPEVTAAAVDHPPAETTPAAEPVVNPPPDVSTPENPGPPLSPEDDDFPELKARFDKELKGRLDDEPEPETSPELGDEVNPAADTPPEPGVDATDAEVKPEDEVGPETQTGNGVEPEPQTQPAPQPEPKKQKKKIFAPPEGLDVSGETRDDLPPEAISRDQGYLKYDPHNERDDDTIEKKIGEEDKILQKVQKQRAEEERMKNRTVQDKIDTWMYSLEKDAEKRPSIMTPHLNLFKSTYLVPDYDGKEAVMAFLAPMSPPIRTDLLDGTENTLDTDSEDLGRLRWIATLPPLKAHKLGEMVNRRPRKVSQILDRAEADLDATIGESVSHRFGKKHRSDTIKEEHPDDQIRRYKRRLANQNGQ